MRDLNRHPTLPLNDGTFDAVLYCVGAQYLQRPVAVFAEVRRLLIAGAPFVVSFSNRYFPTRAVAIWRSLDTRWHAVFIRLYLERAGFTRVALEVLADGLASDPLIAIVGRARSIVFIGSSSTKDLPVDDIELHLAIGRVFIFVCREFSSSKIRP